MSRSFLKDPLGHFCHNRMLPLMALVALLLMAGSASAQEFNSVSQKINGDMKQFSAMIQGASFLMGILLAVTAMLKFKAANDGGGSLKSAGSVRVACW